MGAVRQGDQADDQAQKKEDPDAVPDHVAAPISKRRPATQRKTWSASSARDGGTLMVGFMTRAT